MEDVYASGDDVDNEENAKRGASPLAAHPFDEHSEKLPAG